MQRQAIPDTGPPPMQANRRFVGNNELANRELEHKNLLERQAGDGELVSSLTRRIRSVWETNRNAKRTIEERMLNDLRARRNEYKPETLRLIRERGGSEIYMAITETKCRGAKSWIRDILMPAGDKAWGISPTPMPELPQQVEQMVLNRVLQTTMVGEAPQEITERLGRLRDMAIMELRQDAKRRAQRMEDKIEDQLAESGWDQELLEFIDDFVTFPAAIIKGPLRYRRKELKWGTMDDQFVPVVADVVRPESKRVSPFDIYPSPMSKGINNGDLIEHIRFTRGELYSLIGVPGYKESEIRKVLKTYDLGGLKEWLWNDYERASLENKNNWWTQQTDKDIDGLHFWGHAQGQHLLDWGVPKSKIDDPQREYQVDAILVGQYVIRAVINNDPLGRRPYHKACLDPVPGAFWGNSLPELIEDKQAACNAAARECINNMAMSSGPMMEVFADRLAPGETLEIAPWRTFQTIRGEGNTGQHGNIRFFQADMNARELMEIYDKFKDEADEASMIPRYAYGNADVGGAGSTARGLSMLMNSLSKGIKTAIAQIDLCVMRPMIEQYYFNNMIREDDPTIKGDCKIVARGANALLIKEQTHAERIEFLQMTNNPTDLQIVGVEERARLLRETAASMDMPDLVPNDDEFKARMIEREKQAANQPNEEQIKQQGEQTRMMAELSFKAEQADKDRAARAEEAKKERAAKAAMEQRRITAERAHRMLEQERNQRNEIEQDDPDRRAQQIESMFRQLNEKIAAIAEQQGRRMDQSPLLPAPSPAPAASQPIEVNLYIDSKTGRIRKTVDVTARDSERAVKGLEVIEEPIE